MAGSDGKEPGRIGVERAGAVATMLLDNRPARNAIDRAMWRALPDVTADLEADPSVKVILLAGAGGEAFSSGADISEFASVYATAESAREQNDLMRAGIGALHDCAKPTIAVVEGPCVGGGLALALHADLRFAAASARFAIPPARLGTVYAFDDTKALVARVGHGRAADLLFSGRTVAAEEALAIGLVDRVVPDAELRGTVDAYAEGLCRLSQRSIRHQKTILREIWNGAASETERARALFDASFTSEDFREGYNAFLEKRRPAFPFS
jgi:enoyl-CoA hydratase/carnithine racemase